MEIIYVRPVESTVDSVSTFLGAIIVLPSARYSLKRFRLGWRSGRMTVGIWCVQWRAVPSFIW
jgi:hypothetical protein